MSKKSKKQLKQPTRTTTPLYSSGMSSTLLDIIIPVRGRFDLLERCLDAIPAAFPDVAYNVIIVDNGSGEVEEKPVVEKFYRDKGDRYPNLVLMRNSTNAGFPVACNQGARRKNSPLLFFLNSDVILDPGSGTILLQAMDDPTVGAAGMKLRFADDGDYVDAQLNASIRPSGRLQHIGLSVNVNGEIYHPYLGWDVTHPRLDALRSVFAVTGAALMTRRVLFHQVGGFYEGYGLGTFEDVDLCMQVRERGQQVVVVPAASAVHFTGATLEKLQTAYPLHQNNGLFRSRWADKIAWWDYYML